MNTDGEKPKSLLLTACCDITKGRFFRTAFVERLKRNSEWMLPLTHCLQNVKTFEILTRHETIARKSKCLVLYSGRTPEFFRWCVVWSRRELSGYTTGVVFTPVQASHAGWRNFLPDSSSLWQKKKPNQLKIKKYFPCAPRSRRW